MSGRVSPGAAGQRLAVGGGGIRRAGYAKVTAGRPGARGTRATAMAAQSPGSRRLPERSGERES
jgi:hypothetical protein